VSRKRAGDVPAIMQERERRMLDMLVQGATMREIAYAFDLAPGAASRELRRIAMTRSHELSQVTVNASRAILVDRLELLISRVMPMATGNDTTPPDLKAVEQIVGILKLTAQIQGIPLTAPKEKTGGETTNVTIVTVEQMRSDVMKSLDEVAQRAKTIEGTFGD
jgi:DNA-binding CsgD family transcriptional regulator